MMIPLLEEEEVFLKYLDEDSMDFGFKLKEDAPDDAKKALASYILRVEQIMRSAEV